MFGIKRNSTLLAMAVLGIAAVAGPVKADWNGASAATMTGNSPFSIIGNTITITSGGMQFITSAGKGWTNQILMGIRSIWIIDPVTYLPIHPATGVAGEGYSTNGLISKNWVKVDDGWDSGDSGAGFPLGGPSVKGWIPMQPSGVMSGLNYGVPNNPTPQMNFGSFLFTGISGLTLNTDYLIGLDVLVSAPSGSTVPPTGRIYLTGGNNGGTNNGGGNGQTGSSGNGGNPVPEPGEWAAMGVLSAGLMGLMAKSRRKRSA